MRTVPKVVVLALSGVATLTAGCGDTDTALDDAGRSPVRVAAAFYPLAWVTEQIGGELTDVQSITKPGAEPHDLELTPRDVAAIADADLVVYLDGFQPAIDDAIAETALDAVYDVATAADLDLTFTPIEDGQLHADEAGTIDPHFWLDPSRLIPVAEGVAGELADLDPTHADDYAARAAELVDRLAALDRNFESGLASCTNRYLVTSHNAFGYLARRYGLTQIGIAGLSPHAEPSPTDLADVLDLVEANYVGTVYFETLVSPDIARTVADEAGIAVDVLDPLEGLTEASQGRDYLEVMASNLANLRRGQGCT